MFLETMYYIYVYIYKGLIDCFMFYTHLFVVTGLMSYQRCPAKNTNIYLYNLQTIQHTMG